MDIKVSEQKLIEIFIYADAFEKAWSHHVLPTRCGQLRRSPSLALSEMMTIVIFYHHSGYKCFEYYYKRCVLTDLSSHFPQAPSYSRFVQLIPRYLAPIYWMGRVQGLMAQSTGAYFIDSKKLPVCDNRRIHAHKVFEGIAQRGKSSTGWFFGMKIHLIINNLGDIVNFQLTAANVSDNAKNILDKLFKFIQGKCFGDKGYISKHFEEFY